MSVKEEDKRNCYNCKHEMDPSDEGPCRPCNGKWETMKGGSYNKWKPKEEDKMSRIYFKDKEQSDKKQKFMDKAKKIGADYFEEDYAVFKMPRKVATCRAAISLSIKGNINFGSINESCDNFEQSNLEYFSLTEAKWIADTLHKILSVKW